MQATDVENRNIVTPSSDSWDSAVAGSKRLSQFAAPSLFWRGEGIANRRAPPTGTRHLGVPLSTHFCSIALPLGPTPSPSLAAGGILSVFTSYKIVLDQFTASS
jgi:hypothetical protein